MTCSNRWTWTIFAILPTLWACTEAEDPVPDPAVVAPPTPAVHYELTENLYTTLQAIWKPMEIDAETRSLLGEQPDLVTQASRFADLGLGVELADSEAWTAYNELAPGYAAYATSATTNPAPKSLLYFWHAADQQLIDEESPIRYEGVYMPPLLTGSAYRPQGHLTTQAFEAHVRTARALAEHGERNFDFAIVTGDLTDGSQENELDWFITTMVGGVIDPDSGINDDPVPGPGNDFNDPFTSVGIGAPWYAVIGNHETLYIGSALLNDAIRAAAVSDTVFTTGIKEAFGVELATDGYRPGFRDGATPAGDIVTSGTTPPDPARRILDAPEILQKLQAAPGEPAGHGLTAEQAAAGNADFTFRPVGDKPIVVIAYDTVYRNEMGIKALEYSLGFLTKAQLDWLKSQLDAAAAADEIVILASHHRSRDINDNSPVSGDELVALFSQYDGIVAHLSGHGHYSDAKLCRDDDEAERLCTSADLAEGPNATRGYWELMAPSTADFPIQSRILEFVYEGNGYLSIYTTNIDHNSPVDSLAHEARILAAARRYFQDDSADIGGSVVSDFTARRAYRNMILRYKLPPAIAAKIEAQGDWPTVIQSLDTLATLEGP